MTEKIKALCVKYREILVYLIVGVLTTIFSWLACYVAKFFLDPTNTMQNNIINTIGWVAGVCFAYPLNRRWVFCSSNPHILREFFGFAASRLSTWALELVIMMVPVNSLWLPTNSSLWRVMWCSAAVTSISLLQILPRLE